MAQRKVLILRSGPQDRVSKDVRRPSQRFSLASWRLGGSNFSFWRSSSAVALAEIDFADARVGGDFLGRAFEQDRALHQHRDAPCQAEHQICLLYTSPSPRDR